MKQLETAIYSGILSVIFFIPMLGLDLIRVLDPTTTIYGHLMFFYLLTYVSLTLFMLGFKVLARKKKNKLLENGVDAYLFSVALMYLYAIITLYTGLEGVISTIILVLFGLSTVYLGMGFKSLKKPEHLPMKAGNLLIVAGICNLTIILSFFGAVLLVPITIVQIMILNSYLK